MRPDRQAGVLLLFCGLAVLAGGLALAGRCRDRSQGLPCLDRAVKGLLSGRGLLFMLGNAMILFGAAAILVGALLLIP